MNIKVRNSLKEPTAISYMIVEKMQLGEAMGLKMVGLGRFELPTYALSEHRSNQLSYKPVPGYFLVLADGIEPTTPCLQSRCSTS